MLLVSVEAEKFRGLKHLVLLKGQWKNHRPKEVVAIWNGTCHGANYRDATDVSVEGTNSSCLAGRNDPKAEM